MNIAGYLDDHDISISHVLLTHWHGDHTGGVDDLLLYNSKILVHKHSPTQNQRAIDDGHIFSTEGATLKAVFAPGQTADHTCFVLEEELALFTGDNVLGQAYSVADDLGAYTRSLRLMGRLGCTVGYPGHGDVIRNLPLVIKRYISQRDLREQQVFAALARSCHGSGMKDDHVDIPYPVNGKQIGTVHGLSVADIGSLLYGEVAKDPATFEAALKPLLNQVLFMLAENSKVGSRQVGFSQTRYWFIKT
jgi:glyoxylase-like metal-dependent hydrolase (beta-lactamase superfamily II)